MTITLYTHSFEVLKVKPSTNSFSSFKTGADALMILFFTFADFMEFVEDLGVGCLGVDLGVGCLGVDLGVVV